MLSSRLRSVIPIPAFFILLITSSALRNRNDGTTSLTVRSDGPVCDSSGLLGSLMYYDCALTITRMHENSNHHGEKEFFPPYMGLYSSSDEERLFAPEISYHRLICVDL